MSDVEVVWGGIVDDAMVRDNDVGLRLLEKARLELEVNLDSVTEAEDAAKSIVLLLAEVVWKLDREAFG